MKSVNSSSLTSLKMKDSDYNKEGLECPFSFTLP